MMRLAIQSQTFVRWGLGLQLYSRMFNYYPAVYQDERGGTNDDTLPVSCDTLKATRPGEFIDAKSHSG